MENTSGFKSKQMTTTQRRQYIIERLGKLEDVEFDGIDTKDYPDFSDAYLESATLEGVALTADECDYISENCSDWINEKIFDKLL